MPAEKALSEFIVTKEFMIKLMLKRESVALKRELKRENKKLENALNDKTAENEENNKLNGQLKREYDALKSRLNATKIQHHNGDDLPMENGYVYIYII